MAKKPTTSGLSLTERLLTTGKITTKALISNSEFFKDVDETVVDIPMLNVALTGTFRQGFAPGITTWAGPSRHFKTLFALIQAKAYLDKYPEAMLVLYDSEFGSPLGYFNSVGIDPARVIHVPITSIEELRTEVSLHLAEIKRGDRVVMVMDSIGNLASTKEIEDAEAGSDKADFTRAKVLKSMFRIITPHFKAKNINLIVVNHTYQTMEMFSKTVVGGGTGNIYSSDCIFILGKQQERETSGNKEIVGANFVINVEKSRYVREKSKIIITVLHDGGLQYYSGLFDIALAGQFLVEVKKGRYAKVDPDTGTFDENKTFTSSALDNDGDFWESLLENDKFNTFVEGLYRLDRSPVLGIRGKPPIEIVDSEDE